MDSPYLKIAVISDLHFQNDDTLPKVSRLYTGLLDNPVNSNPISSFKKVIGDNNIEVDYFFILGDVTDKCNKPGFIKGVHDLATVKSKFRANKMLFAIGNHDMHRITGRDRIIDSEYLIKNTDDFPFSLPDIELTRELENYFFAHQFCFIEDDKSIILVLNTSKYMGNELSLFPIQFNESLKYTLENELLKYETSNKFKVALCHHHPNLHSDIDFSFSDLDFIGGGDQLLELLSKSHFSLFMHGHKHFPRLKYENGLPIFCAGSFSSLANIGAFNQENTFHIISIFNHGRMYKGIIETWIYNYKDGWLKSANLTSQFPLYTGFGGIVEIENLARSIFIEFFSEDDTHLNHLRYRSINFEEIAEKFEIINFLIPFEQRKLIQELEKLGISFRVDRKANRYFNLCF